MKFYYEIIEKIYHPLKEHSELMATYKKDLTKDNFKDYFVDVKIPTPIRSLGNIFYELPGSKELLIHFYSPTIESILETAYEHNDVLDPSKGKIFTTFRSHASNSVIAIGYNCVDKISFTLINRYEAVYTMINTLEDWEDYLKGDKVEKSLKSDIIPNDLYNEILPLLEEFQRVCS